MITRNHGYLSARGQVHLFKVFRKPLQDIYLRAVDDVACDDDMVCANVAIRIHRVADQRQRTVKILINFPKMEV